MFPGCVSLRGVIALLQSPVSSPLLLATCFCGECAGGDGGPARPAQLSPAKSVQTCRPGSRCLAAAGPSPQCCNADIDNSNEFTMRMPLNFKICCLHMKMGRTAWTGSFRICSTKQPIDKGFGRLNFNMETTCFIISSPNIVYCVSVSMKKLKSPTAQPAQPSQPHTFFIVDKT